MSSPPPHGDMDSEPRAYPPGELEFGALAPGCDRDELERIQEFLVRTEARSKFSPVLLGVSVLLFVLATWSFGWYGGIALAVVVLVHEFGHFLAMRAFGYTDTSIFLIPLVGGVAFGRPREPIAWKEGVVLLAGPVPGLVAALVVVIGWYTQTSTPMPEWLASLVTIALAINAFNLLPLMPLDGGRVLQIALFSGIPALELAFSIGTGSLLVLYLLWSGSWVLAAFVGLWVYQSTQHREYVGVAYELRARIGPLPGSARDLTLAQLAELWRTARANGAIFDAELDPGLRAARYGVHIARIHQRALAPIASLVTRLGLLVAFGVAWTPLLLFLGLLLLGGAFGGS